MSEYMYKLKTMNRKSKLIVLLVFLGCIISFLTYKAFQSEIEHHNNEINKNNFNVKYEVDGSYVDWTGSAFPSSDTYELDLDKTSCVNKADGTINNAISYANSKVTVSTNQTLYCTLYFYNAIKGYTVYHYQENIDVAEGAAQNTTNYTLKDTDSLTGRVGTNVTPEVNTYTGFTAPSKTTVTILRDGSAAVNYYYTRNSYTLTYNANGGYLYNVNFDYTGAEQTYDIPMTGNYKLEVWGAQGGSYNSTNYGGYGGYSTGVVYLEANDKLYVNVGGSGSCGKNSSNKPGGYNGGGNAPTAGSDHTNCSGGGATHIASLTGLLSTLSTSTNSIYIVAGGGGGGYYHTAGSTHHGYGGSGGGINGGTGTGTNYAGTGGTQESAGCGGGINCGGFGYGGSITKTNHWGSAGGGGFYGGGASKATSGSANSGGGGGSGYIGNTSLTDKYMYCYQCTASGYTTTKTYSGFCQNTVPTKDCAKAGNGYARISNAGEESKRYGSDMGTLLTPSRKGYVFDGWYTEASGGTEVSSTTTMGASNTTIYAHWSEIQPLYYAYGDPTTSSPTTPPTDKNVYVALYPGGEKAVCINRNGTQQCFKNNNVEVEQAHVQEVFSGISCDVNSSYVACSASDFNCDVHSDGLVNCSDHGTNEFCQVFSDGDVYCY